MFSCFYNLDGLSTWMYWHLNDESRCLCKTKKAFYFADSGSIGAFAIGFFRALSNSFVHKCALASMLHSK